MKDQGSNGEGQALNEEKNREIIKQFLKQVEEDPKSLRDVEKKLGERYLACRARVGKLSEQIKEFDRNLTEARIELDREMGKSVGILEAVLAVKE